jgi:hypothetical protein
MKRALGSALGIYLAAANVSRARSGCALFLQARGGLLVSPVGAESCTAPWAVAGIRQSSDADPSIPGGPWSQTP